MIYKIKEYIKSRKIIYKIYFYVMSFLVNALKLFIKSDDHLILFVCYGGKHYSDSPKAIFEYLRADERFSNYKMTWAFVDPSSFNIEGANIVKIDTFKYFVTALKARVWITNVVVERALYFTGKNTFYLCTSHGIPLKGKKEDGRAFQVTYPCLYDVILAQSEFDKKIQQEEFKIGPERIRLLGYPRNDKYSKDLTVAINKVRSYFSIPRDKDIILYAPTFRDWNNGYEFFNLDVSRWEEQLSNNYVLLYRAHPCVKLDAIISDNEFFKNATNYEDLDELLLASDILISDYSSMFFDFSIMHKPMICWAYDYQEFCKYRQLRIDLIHEIYGGEIEENEVIRILKQKDFSRSIEMSIAFQEKYVTIYGDASKAAADLIASSIMN